MRFYSYFVFVLMMCLSTLMFAQRRPGQWVGDMYLVNNNEFPIAKVFLDDQNVIQKTIPNLAKAIDFHVDYEYRKFSLRSYWNNDALYTTAHGESEKNEDGSEFTRWTFAKWKDGEWQFIGDYKTNTKVILHHIPCNDDKFIVICDNDTLNVDNKPYGTPFYRMSILSDKKELRLDSALYHGMDELQPYMSRPSCFDLAWRSQIIMTDGYATLVNYKTGMYWIFSLETALLKRAGMIFNKVTPEMIAKGGFTDAILAANPEKDGAILISAQMEEAFMTETGDAFKETNEMLKQFPTMTQEEALKVLNARRQELVEKNPFIFWYRIYPESGKVERVNLPPDGAELIRDGNKNDVWRPMTDGSVKMGPLVPKDAIKTVHEEER